MVVTASEFTENEAEIAAAIKRTNVTQVSIVQNCSIYDNVVGSAEGTVVQVDGFTHMNARLCWWGIWTKRSWSR